VSRFEGVWLAYMPAEGFIAQGAACFAIFLSFLICVGIFSLYISVESLGY